jgi:hypothetical protein
MYRNSEEEEEYQALPYALKQKYDLESRLDSSLSHKQIMTIIGANEVIRRTLASGGDVDTNKPGVRKTILEKLDDWLYETARSVWYSVTTIIRDAIDYLGNLIARGLDWIDDNILTPIGDFLDDLFG